MTTENERLARERDEAFKPISTYKAQSMLSPEELKAANLRYYKAETAYLEHRSATGTLGTMEEEFNRNRVVGRTPTPAALAKRAEKAKISEEKEAAIEAKRATRLQASLAPRENFYAKKARLATEGKSYGPGLRRPGMRGKM